MPPAAGRCCLDGSTAHERSVSASGNRICSVFVRQMSGCGTLVACGTGAFRIARIAFHIHIRTLRKHKAPRTSIPEGSSSSHIARWLAVCSIFVKMQTLPIPVAENQLTNTNTEMDTLGIEPRASRMLSGCDTTTPRARPRTFIHLTYSPNNGYWSRRSIISNGPIQRCWRLTYISKRNRRGHVTWHWQYVGCPQAH